MSDTPNSATFGFAEMQEFVEAHSDSRVKAIWRRLVKAKSENARWCEAAAAAAKEVARLRLTDAERDDLEMWAGACRANCNCALEVCDIELADRWEARANRAMALIARLGGDK